MTISALGTEVNISKIDEVIHVDKSHGMINFVQETGRADRKRQVVKCRLILSEREYERMMKKDEETLTLNQRVMREFTMTKRCRKRVMSEFMNEKGGKCDQVEGEKCDHCRIVKAREKGGSLERGLLVEMNEKEESIGIERMQ